MPAKASGVARHSVVYIVASILQKLSSLILLPVYTRLLTPEDYGYFNLVVTFLMFAGAFATLGLEYAVVRYCHPSLSDDVENYPGQHSSNPQGRYYTATCTAVVAASAVVVALLVITGPFYSPLIFPGFNFVPIVLIALISLLFQPLTTVFLALLQARSMARSYGIYSVALFISNAVVTVALLGPVDLGLLGVVISLVVVNAIFALLATIRAHRIGLLWVRFGGADLRRILGYSLPMLPHTLTLQATSLGARVIVSNVISVAAAGIFNIAMYAVNFIDAVQTALHRAFTPWYFSHAEQKPPGWRDDVRDVVSAFVATSVAVSASVALFASELLTVATPPAFHDAASIVPMLALSMMVKSVYYPSLSALLYHERGTRAVLLISGSASLVSIPLAVGGAIWWGLTGVAVAQVIQRLMMSAMAVSFSGRIDNPGIPWGRVLRLQFGGLVVIAIVVLGDQSLWWGFGAAPVMIAKATGWIFLIAYLFFCDPSLIKAVRRVLARGR